MRARFSRSSSRVRSSAPAAARHSSKRAPTRRASVVVSGERVEQREVLRRIEQRLVLVLSVQIDERRAELAQRRGRRERVVDERAAAALRRDLAAHDDLAPVGPLEDGLHGRGVLAGADEVGARASADEQVDGLDEDGLAGAGFSREDVQARLELDLEPIDDREMAHAEEAKHVETGTPIVSDL